MRHSLVQTVSVGILVALGLVPSAVVAAEVADCLPEDTVAYVELQGLQELPDALVGLPFWAAGDWLDESRSSYEELLFGALADEMKIERDRAVLFLETCRSIKIAVLAPLASEDGENARRTMPRCIGVLELADLGPAQALVERELAELFGQRSAHGETTVYRLNPEEEDVSLFGAFEANRFVIALGPVETLHEFLDAADGGRDESLGSLPSFQRIADDEGSAPLWGYFNPEPLLGWVKTTLDFDDRRAFDQADALFGFGDFQAVGFSSNFETAPGAVSTSVRLEHDEENTFAKLIHTEPADPEIFRFLTASCLVAGATAVPETGARWKEIRQFIESFERDVIQDDDFAREIGRFKERLGIDLDEAFALVDGQVAVAVPSIDGDVDDDDFTMVFRVADPAAARSLLEKAKADGTRIKSAIADGRLKSQDYRGTTLEWIENMAAVAIVDRYVIVAGSDRAVRAAIDAHSGATPSVASRHGMSLETFAADHAKVLYFDPAFLLGEESETSIAAGRLSPDWGLLVGTDESVPGRIAIESNASVFGALAAAGYGALEAERMGDSRRACSDRLTRLGQYLNEYAAKNGELPKTLADALPPGATADQMRCPLDDGVEDSAPGYVYTHIPKEVADPGYWSFPALYCRHTEHGRVQIDYDGPDQGFASAWSTAENRFRRNQARMLRAIAPPAKENGKGG